jgi:WXG100 family type VII secretion target
MTGELSKQEAALITAAKRVNEAQGDLNGELKSMENKLGDLKAQWRGSGSNAFDAVMRQWQQQQEKLTRALTTFETELMKSEEGYVATDEDQSAALNKYTSRLDGRN